jgi:preprotein translocase subunit SecG
MEEYYMQKKNKVDDEVAELKWVKKMIKSTIIAVVVFFLVGIALAIFSKISIN